MAMTFEQYRDLRKKGYSQSQLQGLNQENKPKSFFSKLGEALKTRASNFADTSRAVNAGQITSPEASLRGAGQIAGAVSDVAGIALGSAAKTAFRALPQQGQENIRSIGTGIAKSRPGQVIMSGMQTGAEAYGGFKQNNPRLATNLEAVGNVASVIPVGFGGKVAGKEGINIAKDVAGLTKRIGKSNIDDVIETGISKGIRPSVVGKNSLSQMNQYKTKAKEAVLNIVKNKNNLSYVDEFGESVTGKLPSSLKELTEAVDQTKKRIFNEYSALATKAGGTGVAVDLNKVTSELGKIVNDKVIQTISPETAQYASNLIERFSKQGSFTPEQAQQAIANLNESLQSFYKNPTYGTYRQAQIDALITNNLRESLDEVITSATGPGYAELKKAYGALKTIEKDAIKRAVVEGRKNAKGLVDFTDIFSAGDVVMGVATGNPAQVAKGAIQKAVSSYIKRLNSPDNAIKQMFKKVEGAIEKGKSSSVPFVPKSMTGKGLQSLKGKGGLNLQTVGDGKAGYSDPLLQEARKYKSAEELFNDPDVADLFKPQKPAGNPFQDTLPSRTRPSSVKEIVKSGGNPLYHDTNSNGVLGILDSGEIKTHQAPFGQLAGQGKRVSTTRNFDNYSRYHNSPYRFVIDESKTGQRAIADNREEFESIFRKNVSTKAVNSLAIDITNPELITDIKTGKFAEVIKKAKEKGVKIETFEGKILPDEYSNKEIQALTKKEVESQLTDLWKKANQSSPDQSLLNEARKYKSAEEFVKSKVNMYHGTPYEFDKFDSSKIMTGEAENAMGRGLYMTDSPNVADYYKRTVTKKPVVALKNVDGTDVDARTLGQITFLKENKLAELPKEQQVALIKQQINAMEDLVRQRNASPDSEIGKLLASYKKIDPDSISVSKYNNRVVKAYGDNSSFIDTKAPLSNEQVTKLKKALGDNYLDWNNIKDGQDLYFKLARKRKNPEKVLSDAGIKGMKYPVGELSAKQYGGSNYVFFDDKNLLTEKQLTDLWKKAQGETKRGFGTGAGRQKTITKAQDSKITKSSLQEVLQDGAKEYIKILEKAKTIDFDAVQRYQDLLKRAPKITDIQSLTRNIAELERKSKLKLMDEAIKIRNEVFDGLRKKNLKK